MKHFIKHLVSRFTRVCTKNHLHLMKGKLSESYLLVKSTPRSKNFSFQLFVCEEFFFRHSRCCDEFPHPETLAMASAYLFAWPPFTLTFTLSLIHSMSLPLSFTLSLSLNFLYLFVIIQWKPPNAITIEAYTCLIILTE